MSRGLLRGTRFEAWSPAQYTRISKLLDEVLALAPDARGTWLTALERRDPEAAADLRDLLEPDESRVEGILAGAGDLADQLASLPEADRSLVGRQFGPYRVRSLLGHGGMGSVWLAERVDGLFERRVALKLVHPALMSLGLAERLSRECAILASLDHPNIARIFDAGVSADGQPYLALEYVAGIPLVTYCDNRRLPVRERLALFRQVLSAVHYAHAHLVIHRDLKPSNILVTDEGRVCLLDFGIAKLLREGTAKETELTQLSGRALSPDYAAPEQIAGAPITIAADVYALGVVLYELLTGQGPYRLARHSRGALEEAILWADVPLPSRVAVNEAAAGARTTTVGRLARALRGDLDTIVMKALRKSPVERYPTVDALGEDVARWFRGEPVLARRYGLGYRAVKFARRHWAAVAVTAVFTLMLVAGLAATSYEARVAQRQRDTALQAQLRSLTQTAAARLRDGDAAGALSIILEVLPHRGVKRAYTPDALAVFEEARAADSQILAFAGHTEDVTSVDFSPDGQRLLTGSLDKTARVWNAGTAQELLVLKGGSDQLYGTVFSPDGRRILAASIDKTARIWDAATGREMLQLKGHTDRIYGAAFSRDGRRTVTASADRTARIWDTTTGLEVRQLGHGDKVYGAAFSPDGRRVITGSHDKIARIWDATTGRQILQLVGHAEDVSAVAFSTDGRHVVTASYDKTARLWEAATGRTMAVLTGHADGLVDVRFSRDGQRVITASADHSARIWDAVYGREIAVFVHPAAVSAVALSPDGHYVATGSEDGTARLWNASTDWQSLAVMGHSEQVSAAAFSPDGRRIVTASFDRTATIWDAQTAGRLTTLRGHSDRVFSAAFSADGRRVVTASRDHTARVWDVSTGQEMLRLTGHTGLVPTAAYSPDGQRIVTASSDGTARIWDAATGRELRQLKHTDKVQTAQFSPDGRRVITACHDKTARIWDSTTGLELLRLEGHESVVGSAAFSPDAHRAATASDDGTARLWDASTGRELLQLRGHRDQVIDAAFSPDGRRIATASRDRSVRVWDAETGRAIAVYKGHDDEVESAAFSPDGRRIVTASLDKTARVWDARIPGLEHQLAWAEAAQFDGLTGSARLAFGLHAPTGVREWPAAVSRCDRLAAAPYDPDRRSPGAPLVRADADQAVAACSLMRSHSADAARATYQRGRALVAAGNLPAARRDFEEVIARGYRAARVDLGRLLADSSAGTGALPQAISLYEQAWRDGVSIAAFELGRLYEHGVTGVGNPGEYLLAPDVARAWLWYRRAAESQEPNALARFGEQGDGAAFTAATDAERNARFLESFRYFASAAERARDEGWPDDAWRGWRYRRASLARLLARAGMMEEVAGVYERVRGADAATPSAIWDRLAALAGLQ